MSRKKKLFGLATALAVTCLLVSGTFAWTQYTSKTNAFVGSGTVSEDVVLHDDFNPETGQKDIYVESSSSKKRVFARVMLSEYMDLLSNTEPDDLDYAESYSKYYKKHFNPSMASATDCGQANNEGMRFHDYFTWEMGGSKLYLSAFAENASEADMDPAKGVFRDLTEYSSVAQGVDFTPFAQLTSISQYLELSEQEKLSLTDWVYDTDGYAYWSQPLGAPAQGTAITPVTGLLLHKITANPRIADTDYYYAVNVRVEAVDKTDLPMWTTESGLVDAALDMPLGAPASDGSGRMYPVASQAAMVLLDKLAAISDAAR